jgi:hypothetical protein
MKTLKIAVAIVTLAMITSAASADAIWLQVAPGDTPTPGGTITIELIADTAIDGWRMDGLTGPVGTSVSNFKVHALAGINGNHEAKVGYVDNFTYGGLTYLWEKWHCESNRGTMPAGEILASFDLTIHSTWDGVTPFTLDLLGKDELYYWDATEPPEVMEWDPQGMIANEPYSIKLPIADLTIVPEPASLALLGVGGLALLRKRRS